MPGYSNRPFHSDKYHYALAADAAIGCREQGNLNGIRKKVLKIFSKKIWVNVFYTYLCTPYKNGSIAQLV